MGWDLGSKIWDLRKREEGHYLGPGISGRGKRAIWVVIWESFGESFGASFGSHFPLPWELPNSYYLRFIGDPLPEPAPPYIVAKTAPKRGAPKESIRLLLALVVDVGKAPRKRPPMRAI